MYDDKSPCREIQHGLCFYDDLSTAATLLIPLTIVQPRSIEEAVKYQLKRANV